MKFQRDNTCVPSLGLGSHETLGNPICDVPVLIYGANKISCCCIVSYRIVSYRIVSYRIVSYRIVRTFSIETTESANYGNVPYPSLRTTRFINVTNRKLPEDKLRNRVKTY